MGYIRYAIKNSFKSQTVYRTYTFVSVISAAFGLLIQVAIWKALYNGENIINTEYRSVYLSDMIQYVVLSSLISILVNNNVIYNIEQRILSGQVSIDFIRPVGFSIQIICAEIANICFNFLFTFLPMLLISFILAGSNVFKISNIAIVLFVTVNSIIIFFTINYMIGLLAFWFLTIWPLRQILDGVIKLLSGAFIPLWFLPASIYKIAEYLPFKLIYYFPISAALGKISEQEFKKSIVLQIIWIIILVAICSLLWHKGNKKLTVQGG